MKDQTRFKFDLALVLYRNIHTSFIHRIPHQLSMLHYLSHRALCHALRFWKDSQQSNHSDLCVHRLPPLSKRNIRLAALCTRSKRFLAVSFFLLRWRKDALPLLASFDIYQFPNIFYTTDIRRTMWRSNLPGILHICSPQVSIRYMIPPASSSRPSSQTTRLPLPSRQILIRLQPKTLLRHNCSPYMGRPFMSYSPLLPLMFADLFDHTCNFDRTKTGTMFGL